MSAEPEPSVETTPPKSLKERIEEHWISYAVTLTLAVVAATATFYQTVIIPRYERDKSALAKELSKHETDAKEAKSTLASVRDKLSVQTTEALTANQRLTISKEHETRLKQSVKEHEEQISALNELLTKKVRENDSLETELAALRLKSSEMDDSKLSKDELETRLELLAKQEEISSQAAYSVWKAFVGRGRDNVNFAIANFTGRLSKGLNYQEAAIDLAQIKQAFNQLHSFTSMHAFIHVEVKNEMRAELRKRFMENAFKTQKELMAVLSEDLKPLISYRAEFRDQAAPENNGKIVEWILIVAKVIAL